MNSKAQTDKDARIYPGIATNIGSDCRNDKKAVKENVRELNNNPRNNDDKMP